MPENRSRGRVIGAGKSLASWWLVSGLVLVILAGPATAAQYPLVSRLSSPAKAVTGSKVKVVSTVRNSGRKAVKRVVVAFVLSTDPRRSRSDALLGSRNVNRLKGHRSSTLRIVLRIPAKLEAGRYRLLACVGARCRANRFTLVRPAGGHPIGGGPTPPGGGGGVHFPLHANPLRVGEVTDAARAVTQLVPTTGGTLRASAADGTTFTLTIPADALLSPEQITMTPVTSLAGTTMSLLGAVQLEPEVCSC